jgi:hypothetical protein
MSTHYLCPRCLVGMANLQTPIEGAYIAMCPVCNHSFWFYVTSATNVAFRAFLHWSVTCLPASP